VIFDQQPIQIPEGKHLLEQEKAKAKSLENYV
jgi:hypothetical protein